jgi:hypothetical protein
MTDQNTQTAVDETKAAAPPAATDAQDARQDGDSLDALLKEYDQTAGAPPAAAATPPEPKPGTDTTTTKPATDPAVAEVQRYIFRQDMDKTVKSVRGELPADYFDDTFVKAWIDSRAEEDPRLGQAWVNRHSNPKQFEKIVSGLGREFSKKYGKLPDRAATDDRDAVTAAVRGASTRAPEGQPADYSRMTDAQLAAEKDKLFGR